NSLFVLTFDEDDYSSNNHVATIFTGARVVMGQYGEPVTHYRVLRTLEDVYNLPYAGLSGAQLPITDTWASGAATATPTPAPSATATPPPTATGTPTCAPDYTYATGTATIVPGTTLLPGSSCNACAVSLSLPF